MREKFVADLVMDVLGPRQGIREIMTESPLSEYITGVLSPARTETLPQEPEAEMVELEATPDEETGRPEDDADLEEDVLAPPRFAPVLDPRSRPASFGISFLVESETHSPEADICLTWARYSFEQNSSAWRREPRRAVFRVRLNEETILWFDDSGQPSRQPQRGEISFHVAPRPTGDGMWMVNLYFVNRISPPSGRRPAAEHHIFQPQIRVVCCQGTRIVPVRSSPGDDEEAELAFLYRTRPVMARGFLCSAVWRDIDPHRDFSEEPDFPESLESPPYGWPDGALLPSEERRKFALPDVRSEFVPVCSVPFPEMKWPDQYGDPPVLEADRLAGAFEPSVLEAALRPLVEAYRNWVEEQERQTQQLSADQQRVVRRLSQRRRNVLRRMEAGLDLLLKDEEVRLAFCFASKAMDLQSRWTRKSSLKWRPFQLGYILSVIESVANRGSPDREVCDLLWIPTGGGKTEAYLFVILFTLALRRRRAIAHDRPGTGAGVAVIMRYTLRLLTIQQFRRLLAAITACEYLRVEGLLENARQVGWKPPGSSVHGNFIWGTEPFSAGLWVGGGVTPNRLKDTWGGNRSIPGALDILRGKKGEGEPAQVVDCPACKTLLAIPETGVNGPVRLHLVVRMDVSGEQMQGLLSQLTEQQIAGLTVRSVQVNALQQPGYFTLSFDLDAGGKIRARDVDQFWQSIVSRFPEKPRLIPARASRPGYFIRWYRGQRRKEQEYDFDIFCPAPDCSLRRPWCAGAPLGRVHGRSPTPVAFSEVQNVPEMNDGNRFVYVEEAFQLSPPHFFLSDRIPIPALTVDEQVYHRLPSVVVATVDKFARPPFEPRAAAIFGNVDHYHCIWGYYRKGAPPASATSSSNRDHPSPMGSGKSRLFIPVHQPDPPELILQDELHLIEGPLGSLVGFYETAVDFLCTADEFRPKYIASTATVRSAEEQVKVIFARDLAVFPPPGLSADDRFFIRERELHPLDDTVPGRLYLGICAPGRGPLTPLVRIYARLLQTAGEVRQSKGDREVDPFWTLTGYFNAIRELGGARALYRQDIPERIQLIAGNQARSLSEDRVVELSSRTSSTELPVVLERLNASCPAAPDALFTTSMFGTGVDIPRLSLMVVNGQPKTTSSYIQATGRVGRRQGALVITFLRATRPRDLNHYEFFCGYHRQLHRFVEPVTVYSFAPGVLERAAGPVAVFLLRSMRNARISWHEDSSAASMQSARQQSEVRRIVDILEEREQNQPGLRRFPGTVRSYVESELDRWQNVARICGQKLRYVEYAITSSPQSPVVLGDPAHQYSKLDVVYKNTPQSLRDVEETCGFET